MISTPPNALSSILLRQFAGELQIQPAGGLLCGRLGAADQMESILRGEDPGEGFRLARDISSQAELLTGRQGDTFVPLQEASRPIDFRRRMYLTHFSTRSLPNDRERRTLEIAEYLQFLPMPPLAQGIAVAVRTETMAENPCRMEATVALKGFELQVIQRETVSFDPLMQEEDTITLEVTADTPRPFRGLLKTPPGSEDPKREALDTALALYLFLHQSNPEILKGGLELLNTEEGNLVLDRWSLMGFGAVLFSFTFDEAGLAEIRGRRGETVALENLELDGSHFSLQTSDRMEIAGAEKPALSGSWGHGHFSLRERRFKHPETQPLPEVVRFVEMARV